MNERTVRYEGSPAIAGALADMLRKKGVDVSYTSPEERRGAAEMAEAVTVYFICKGGDAAIEAAVQQFRERFGGSGGTAEVEDDD